MEGTKSVGRGFGSNKGFNRILLLHLRTIGEEEGENTGGERGQ